MEWLLPAIVVIALVLVFGKRLGRLPGDVRVSRPGLHVSAPLASSCLVSIVLSVVLSLALGLCTGGAVMR